MGFILIFYALTWLVNALLAEYNVRKLQSLGTVATPEQFPEVHDALREVCGRLGVAKLPRLIVISHSQVNAMAIKFARKRVVVLFSETLEGMLESPDELRFILGHEVAHTILDHGSRGIFELYKPAPYRAARELTCDNCGLLMGGDPDSARMALKRLGVGNRLAHRLNDDFLMREGVYIYSGLTGWLLRQYLTHPPLGKRIANINESAARWQ
jgi:Zn-dependent protease with chaperone function